MSSDSRLHYIIVPHLKSIKAKSFLDIGCGFGIWGCRIRIFSNPRYLVGVDIWKPYLLQTKSRGVYDDVILADALNLPIRKKAFDITLACEIIEHLPKSKAKLFLDSLEDLTKEKIIISTPNYEYIQNEIRGNPFEKHISFYKYSDFIKKYKISGVGFQIQGKLFAGGLPFFGRILRILILYGKLCRFSELIVAARDMKKKCTV